VSGTASDIAGPRRVAQLGLQRLREISFHAVSRRSS